MLYLHLCCVRCRKLALAHVAPGIRAQLVALPAHLAHTDLAVALPAATASSALATQLMVLVSATTDTKD